MSHLILVRHGLSEYNKKSLWTGWTDVELAPEGYKEAAHAGSTLKDFSFDKAYVADLKRCTETLKEILKVLEQEGLETEVTPALRERDYGDLTGKNKWDVQKEFGDKQFMKWRRGWDEPIPNGESLKDVYDRLVPFYQERVEPDLEAGKTVLVSASGNSLRALVKYLEKIPDGEVSKLEIGTGEVLVYDLNDDGSVKNKEVRSTNPKRGTV